MPSLTASLTPWQPCKTTQRLDLPRNTSAEYVQFRGVLSGSHIASLLST